MDGELQLEATGLQNPSKTGSLLDVLQSNSDSSLSAISSKRNYRDIEAGSVLCCRICLESDAEDDRQLISPCMCKGTQQFVHRSCLDHWRSVKEGFAFSHCSTCKARFHLRIADSEANSWRKIKFRLFIARDVFLVFLAVQMAIGLTGCFAYLVDGGAHYKNALNGNGDPILAKHPFAVYYCIGVLLFLVSLGSFGVMLHCSSFNDPRLVACQNYCLGWGLLDCFPASTEACFIIVVAFAVICVVLGIVYAFIAASMVIQRICQRHYHILTKRALTQEYVVLDLHGNYTPPVLDEETERRLRMLKLM